MSLNVFISYAKEDQKIAIRYYEWLENEGFTPWLDIKKIKGGQNWELEITRAFKNANVIILLMSPQSVNKRGFVQREVKDALDNLRYKQPDDIYIIPVIIENCEVPDYISKKLQFIKNIDDSAFDSLKSSLLTAAEQQSISVTSGTPIGPYLIKDNEFNEVWDDNLGYKININYPSFNSNKNKTISSELNAYFLGKAIKTLSELRHEKIEECNLISEEWYVDLKNEYSESFGIAYASENILSISLTIFIYSSGAAHGNFIFETLNFDTRDTLIKIRLDDLFKVDCNYLERISELTIQQLCREHWEKTGEDADDNTIECFRNGASPNAANFENFLITDKGLTFLFPPYQVGPYAMGSWTVEIPYFELRDLLRSNGPYSYLNDNHKYD